MHIRTFRAASLQEALQDIRRQMGEDASVLHTRQVREGWLGWLGKTSVEVTAGLRADRGTASGDSPAITPTDRQDSSARRGYPLELQDLRELLSLAGVAPPIADRWIDESYAFGSSLASGVEPGQWMDVLRQTVARGIRVARPIEVPTGRQRIVALVGPTGVGKTTTIAKLAAGFRLESHRRVALLTIDTFRIAAVQQLQAYAEIMDLPMEVVSRADEMPVALQRLEDAELVLVDTVGRSPRDARVQQLDELLQAAAPDEIHLVVSATGSRDVIAATIAGFAPLKPDAVLLTKLDETPQLAVPLSVLADRGLPLSYVTTGQQVPDDIETPEASLLGEQLLTSAAHMVPPDTAVIRYVA